MTVVTHVAVVVLERDSHRASRRLVSFAAVCIACDEAREAAKHVKRRDLCACVCIHIHIHAPYQRRR